MVIRQKDAEMSIGYRDKKQQSSKLRNLTVGKVGEARRERWACRVDRVEMPRGELRGEAES